MDVGVRELKAQLSSYLDRAAAGETITVTDRGRPKVQIVALPGGPDPLARAVDQGWVRPAERPGPLAPFIPVMGERRVLDVLAEDRADG